MRHVVLRSVAFIFGVTIPLFLHTLLNCLFSKTTQEVYDCNDEELMLQEVIDAFESEANRNLAVVDDLQEINIGSKTSPRMIKIATLIL